MLKNMKNNKILKMKNNIRQKFKNLSNWWEDEDNWNMRKS